jgi:hypothetical protein
MAQLSPFGPLETASRLRDASIGDIPVRQSRLWPFCWMALCLLLFTNQE